jgi:hypothetical protein
VGWVRQKDGVRVKRREEEKKEAGLHFVENV